MLGILRDDRITTQLRKEPKEERQTGITLIPIFING